MALGSKHGKLCNFRQSCSAQLDMLRLEMDIRRVDFSKGNGGTHPHRKGSGEDSITVPLGREDSIIVHWEQGGVWARAHALPATVSLHSVASRPRKKP